ncbi:MAG TPA: ATP-binding cassette domain-containing protein, partial [Solirubrobacterales bacterium]|nr:ATP-binding cassette domain-containing protein [Solirubrobacterales bacterium]
MFGSSAETEAREQQQPAAEKAQGQMSRDVSVTATSTEAPTAAPDRRAKTLEAESVDLYYGDFHAVADVTMTIEPNKVTALIGSSGCGKTTFLRSLNRMHELTPGASVKGEITLDGEDMYAAGVDP